MKKIILLSCICPLSLLASAQLMNGGFEDWTPSGSPPPFDWQEPAGWQSNNAVTEFSSATIRKSTDVHSGAAAVQISKVNLFGNDVPGILCNGNPPVDYPNYTIKLAEGGIPYTSRPASLNGFYKLTGAGSDSAMAMVLLKKHNSGNTDTIGIGMEYLHSNTSYESFTIAINYLSASNPDSVLVVFRNTNFVFLVDDVSLSAQTGLANPGIVQPEALRMYPNPARGEEVALSKKDDYVITNLPGEQVASAKNTSVLMIGQLPEGTYIVRGSRGSIGKLVILR